MSPPEPEYRVKDRRARRAALAVVALIVVGLAAMAAVAVECSERCAGLGYEVSRLFFFSEPTCRCWSLEDQGLVWRGAELLERARDEIARRRVRFEAGGHGLSEVRGDFVGYALRILWRPLLALGGPRRGDELVRLAEHEAAAMTLPQLIISLYLVALVVNVWGLATWTAGSSVPAWPCAIGAGACAMNIVRFWLWPPEPKEA